MREKMCVAWTNKKLTHFYVFRCKKMYYKYLFNLLRAMWNAYRFFSGVISLCWREQDWIMKRRAIWEQTSGRATEIASAREIRVSIYNEPQGGYASNPLLPPAEKPLAQSSPSVTKTREVGLRGSKYLTCVCTCAYFPGGECGGRTCTQVDQGIRTINDASRPRNCAVAVVVVFFFFFFSSSSSSSSRSSSKTSACRRERVTHWETLNTVFSPRVPLNASRLRERARLLQEEIRALGVVLELDKYNSCTRAVRAKYA